MIVLVGCNHRSAPVALREKIAFADEQLADALRRLRDREGVHEALILSTCNRVEVLVRAAGEPLAAVQAVRAFLGDERGMSPDELERHGYHYVSREAVRHLFQVATGLDSMILGEPQILGQVKQAYLAAKQAGTTGPVLERLLQQCLASAKRVRHETGISRNAVSVAYAAVELARQIFGKLAGRRALILGAGKMSELVAKHMVSNEVSEVIVASRTYNHAVRAAERFNGKPLNWEDGLLQLDQVDIVISCTGAPTPILDRSRVARALRRRRGKPLFLIDLAVPRDIDPLVNGLDNVYLYDIDGLQGVVDANLKERRQAAERAERLISADVEAFDRWRQAQEITPTIVALRESFAEIARGELERFRRRLGPLSADQERALEELVRAMTQKILHRPTVHLRSSGEQKQVEQRLALYREIFGLDPATIDDVPEDRQSNDNPPERDEPPRGPTRVLRGGKKG